MYGSQGQLLHRLNATTNTATDYIAIANTTVAEVERVGSNDSVRYPYFDQLGSAVKMGNASGGLINSEQAIFLPFGERWGTTNQAANGRGFTGHVDDTELGLTYMQARYYDPVIGRFYANDPVGTLGHLQNGNIQGFNRYAYANNNPYSYVDPGGREVVWVGTEDEIEYARSAVEEARRLSKNTNRDLEALEASHHVHVIQGRPYNTHRSKTIAAGGGSLVNPDGTAGVGSGSYITIGYEADPLDGTKRADPATTAAHEIGHAQDLDSGVYPRDPDTLIRIGPNGQTTPKDEVGSLRNENEVRAAKDMKIREYYNQ
ncbi:RHS repeat-associated protein [Umboniibacter marinipuniceus]|uniref:RHS repeat-associated protein n=1 Tax=Umboniibacter marinipuniceus TaxID=569599 RepID=A0A3M0AC69_9GAMM|nr:RHS repeat-associated protein [Umboniibacter marinipuniceus]